MNPTLFDKIPYDPIKDLTPITLAVTTPQFVVVHPSVPASTMTEFIGYAKKNPGKLSYASVSVGSASHLTMEMLKSAAGIDLTHVPYKGSGPAVTDLLGGQVHAAMLVPGNVLPHLKTGKLKVLATTGRKRFAATPDIPTLIESGFPDFEAVAWIGFMAPGGTARAIVDAYHAELVRILSLREAAPARDPVRDRCGYAGAVRRIHPLGDAAMGESHQGNWRKSQLGA